MTGCGSDAGTTERLGVEVTPAANVYGPRLLWSADDSEVYFISGTGPLLVVGTMAVGAAKADGGGVRIIDDSKDTYVNIAAPANGSALYYLAQPFVGTPELYDAFEGRKVVDIEGGTGPLVVTPDNRSIVYSDLTVTLYDAISGAATRLIADSLGWQDVVFSPPGDALFGVASGHLVIVGTTVDLGGNILNSRTLQFPDSYGTWVSASWSDSGIRVMSEFATDIVNPVYRINNLTSGAVTQVGLSHFAPGHASWSPDGRRVAIWRVICTDPGFACSGFRSELHVVDADSGGVQLIAQGNSAGGLVAFSHDGARLAYSFKNKIYVSEAP